MLMAHVACKSKLRSVVRSLCIDAQEFETGRLSGVWSCIMPVLPMHLMQELNVSPVHVGAGGKMPLS